jgi:hypothetical protein
MVLVYALGFMGLVGLYCLIGMVVRAFSPKSEGTVVQYTQHGSRTRGDRHSWSTWK